jgi:hypothetical protein
MKIVWVFFPFLDALCASGWEWKIKKISGVSERILTPDLKKVLLVDDGFVSVKRQKTYVQTSMAI